MNHDPLDRTLAAYARQPGPACPEHLTACIWGAIERRRRQSGWSRIFPVLAWRDLFREPRLAWAALGFALLIGMVPAVVLARAENTKRLARESIHFGVFAAPAGDGLAFLGNPAAHTHKP